MFKKTLVAASLLMAFNASALTITGTGSGNAIAEGKVSTQQIAVVKATDPSHVVTLDTLTVTLAKELIDGNLIKVDFIGGGFFDATPSVEIVASGGTSTNTADLRKIAKNDNSVTYKIENVTSQGSNSFVNSKIVFTKTGATKVDIQTASITSPVEMVVTTMNHTDNNKVVETAKVQVIDVVDQFSYAASAKYDSVIDVNADRKNFEAVSGVGDSKIADVFTFEIKDELDGVSGAVKVAPSKIDYVLKGDFTFLDQDPKLDGIQTTKVTAPSGAKVEADKIAWSASSLAASTVKIDITDKDNKSAAVALSPNDFDLSATITYTGGTQTFNESAGAWTLNGASADIPYVPVGEGLSQFIWVSNKGSIAGDISVTAIDQSGKAYGPYDLGMANKGLTPIASSILAKLKEDGLTSGRVQMNVTVNAPEKAVTVYAAYKVDSADDRLSLPVNKLTAK